MNAVRATYPTLCEFLAGTPFEDDARVAAGIAKSKQNMKAALEGRVFALNELMWLLCQRTTDSRREPDQSQEYPAPGGACSPRAARDSGTAMARPRTSITRLRNRKPQR